MTVNQKPIPAVSVHNSTQLFTQHTSSHNTQQQKHISDNTHRYIKVIQINLQHSKMATANLSQIVIDFNFDVALIQEPSVTASNGSNTLLSCETSRKVSLPCTISQLVRLQFFSYRTLLSSVFERS